uniref:Uncharacterized protein n=1 Tax=Aureoumbra lagunensis TaxID=44058 RepID=A0A7S3NDQ0_9STRA|mmetsp:Transcript_1961/g.2974  ORF Transcript_1961/g.2974 Transcript_1961/m.2974 type:complete len:503 (+) Transcript_1961:112-1620(+)
MPPSSSRRRVSLRRVIVYVTAVAAIALLFVHGLALNMRYELSNQKHEQAEVSADIPKVVTDLDDNEPEVHVVFSTDCGSYQHWQSIAVWYSSRQVGHRGPVTRIASGCTAEQRSPIVQEYSEIDTSGQFRAHFAPAGELKGNYKYSNKPSGLYHWLTTAQPRPFQNPTNGIVALIDPDQFLLRPITAAVSLGLDPKVVSQKIQGGGISLFETSSGKPRIIVGRKNEIAALPSRVSKGKPVAQEYGIGGAWGNSGKPNARPSWKAFDIHRVCGKDAPCTRTSAKEADESYSVGPPYLLHATDATNIAESWLKAVPQVHAQYPYLLAEMYAYSMAAANLSLPHAQVHNLMVSNIGAGGEAWDWVDTISWNQVCAGADLTTPPSIFVAPSIPFSNNDHPPGPALPTVLHFCQSYRAGGHKFGKHSVPHDIFSCEQGLFHFEPDQITDAVRQASSAGSDSLKKATRNAFFLCNLLPRLNAALLSYKSTVCPKRGISTWNSQPTVRA